MKGGKKTPAGEQTASRRGQGALEAVSNSSRAPRNVADLLGARWPGCAREGERDRGRGGE